MTLLQKIQNLTWWTLDIKLKDILLSFNNILSNSAPIQSPTFTGEINGESITLTSDIEAIGFKTPTGTSQQFLKADGSIDSNRYQLENIPNDTDVASALNEGKMRYRTDANNSYIDMCMKVGIGNYAWQNIMSNNWA